jgi:hypothetical protein
MSSQAGHNKAKGTSAKSHRISDSGLWGIAITLALLEHRWAGKMRMMKQAGAGNGMGSLPALQRSSSALHLNVLLSHRS